MSQTPMSPTTATPPGRRPRIEPIRRRRRQLPFPLNLYQTSVGRKWVMALTGIGLLGFVLVHMIGNLHVYEGPAKLHEYAEALRDLGGGIIPRTWLLWALRIGLIALFGLHIHAAYTVKEHSRKASVGANVIDGQKSYDGGRDYIAANYASRTMRWTGPIILLYLFYHLADLTWGWWLGDDFVRGDPYHNLVQSLSSVPVAIIYIVATVALAVHIYHGAWSMFQSLGINNPRYNSARRTFAVAFAGVILVGNLSFPILTQAGVIDDENYECSLDVQGSDEAVLECLEQQLAEEE